MCVCVLPTGTVVDVVADPGLTQTRRAAAADGSLVFSVKTRAFSALTAAQLPAVDASVIERELAFAPA